MATLTLAPRTSLEAQAPPAPPAVDITGDQIEAFLDALPAEGGVSRHIEAGDVVIIPGRTPLGGAPWTATCGT